MDTQQSPQGNTKDLKASGMAGSISDKIRTGIDQVESKIGDTQFREQLDKAKSKVQAGYQTALGYVKENPLYAVLGAAALGFVVAGIFRSSSEE